MQNPMKFLPEPEIKYTQKSKILGEFEVNIHSSTMKEKMNTAFSRLQNKVKIPGYRPGKVPLEMVKKKYHEDVLHEVFNQVVSETYRKGAIDNKVPVASDPYITKTNLNEWKDGENLSYTAQVDLIPSVELKKYKGLTATKKESKIEQKDVDIVLKNLLDPRAEFVALDANTKAKEGQFALLDFQGSLEGKPLKDSDAKDFMLELGSQNSLKEFQDGILGMKAGENKTITVNYPEDYKNTEIAGKSVIYEVQVKELKEKKYPEITEEIAKEFQAESKEDLLAKIKKSLEDELVTEQKQQTTEEILYSLVESNPIDVPVSLVQRQLQHILGDVSNMLKRQQYSENVIADYFRKHSKEFEQRAEKEVKLALLLPKVIEEEKITTNEEDLKKHFDEIVKQSGQKIEAIEKFYETNTQRKTELIRELERKKAIDLLIQHAVIK
ncbi:MAG: trigger factor [Oligoflexia bacterium]|nr:trigger factor [Oligoflexia bacterium]